MSELEVRIVRLEPMRVAAALGFGPSPEELAWNKILTWIEAVDLWGDGQPHRFFGFNNPDPSPASPNYGYEQWVTVGPDAQLAEGIEIKAYAGGLYAVTRCTLDVIGCTWHRLATWCDASPYRIARHQWLEEGLTPPRLGEAMRPLEETIMDLYLPIAG